MPAKKVQSAKLKVTKKVVVKKITGLSVPVYSLLGVKAGEMSLPKEIFGVEVNKKLLSQMARVYLNNQKSHPGSTKTRGQVQGSSVKIYAQKGTGRARHGSVRAPIFVGGGIVFGPTPRKIVLELPKKMKKAALISAFSDKAAENKILGLSGIEKASGKTKEIISLLQKITDKKQNVLIMTDKKLENVLRAVKNIQNVTVLSLDAINPYEVVKNDLLLLTKEAVEKLIAPKDEKI